MTGDTHQPEIKSNQPVEEESPIGLGTTGMQSGLAASSHEARTLRMAMSPQEPTGFAS
ncbi:MULTISPECIES: hypothetical protein [unclassified Polaromonas]|uniref:hypothetical protein n=1 Tax=unclassified Polaromonas TaxID=2638319 RepID=UPI0018CA69EC|nr:MULTISPECIES: hypothetical protein [unclassified Polaromonas]MBG6073318.1 hypothetical protein [Polaromonas sp. CG_9.7]MBG6115342.1 hypothetical protein [Polaromonas sp. CG_9.2]MDH6182953.1 hypothetical protein [Polaromonas sp. CG_23.6]